MEKLKRDLKRIHGWEFENEENAGLEEVSTKAALFHDVPKLHFKIPLEEIVKKVAENALNAAKTEERLEAKLLTNKARKYLQKTIMENLGRDEKAREELLDEIHRQVLPVVQEYCEKIMEKKNEKKTRKPQIQLEDILKGKKWHIKLEIGVPKTPKDG